MAEVSKGLSQEYWRPAPTPGNQFKMHGFQVQGNEGFCTICGTSYAPGALFCHLCGLSREDDLRVKERNPIMDWLDLEHIREQSGLSTLSLVLVLAAAVFMLATVMTGLVYTTSTVAEWQAVQTWRIEWLLATVAALMAAMLFKSKS
jgi:hypothetical protein